MGKLIRHFKPTLVVTQLYSNDIYSDKLHERIAKKDSNGQVISIPGPSNNWIKLQLRKSYLLRLFRKIQLQLQWMNENESLNNDVIDGNIEENPDISEISLNFVKKLASEVTKFRF